MTDDIVDAVALALWQQDSVRAAGRPRLIEWSEVGDAELLKWRDQARAAIAAARPFILEEAARLAETTACQCEAPSCDKREQAYEISEAIRALKDKP